MKAAPKRRRGGTSTGACDSMAFKAASFVEGSARWAGAIRFRGAGWHGSGDIVGEVDEGRWPMIPRLDVVKRQQRIDGRR